MLNRIPLEDALPYYQLLARIKSNVIEYTLLFLSTTFLSTFDAARGRTPYANIKD